MMQCSQNKCCQTYLHHSFIMKWQQQSNVYKTHRPMMHIMKVMKDIVSMIQKRFEKYDLIIADELGYISFDREAADLLCNR